MFKPKYNITNYLLSNIRRINTLINELNNRRFPNVVLLEFERTAREISTYASTSIEGNPLPLTEVKKILKSKPEHARESQKEVLNYNQALQDLNEKIEEGRIRLSLDRILNIQKQVTKGLIPKSDWGELRQGGVAVNDPLAHRIVYLPPDAKDTRSLMENLVEFVNKQSLFHRNKNKDKVDSLIIAGIFHKQMVVIHPFMDGNGRTTRLATKMLLAHMGLNTFNLFSFENYYNKNVTKYFKTVGEYGNYYDLADKIDFTGWLEYFTEGIIDELLRVQKLLPKIDVTPKTQLQPYHLKILDFIREKGFITHKNYAKLTGRAKATRALDFQKLTTLGLIERKGRGRATYYVLKKN